MRMLICGGRDYRDRISAFAVFDRAHKKREVTLVIHGACMKKGSIELTGGDRWAEEWARTHEIPYVGVPAPWASLPSAAGPVRNQMMLDAWKPEGVIALPGGDGTADMVGRARKAGIPVWEPVDA